MDKMSITASRLKEALELRGMRQVDLAEKTGIGKSAISQYLSGKVLPKQDKLYLLARALQVSEDWLLGRTGIPTNDVERGETMADEVLERLQRIEKKLDLVLEMCATSGVNMERGWVLTERAYSAESLLTDKQLEFLELAKQHGLPIVIDGDRSKPTGKSTVCEYLRDRGFNAYEAWMFEDGVKMPDSGANSVYVAIRLDKSF